MSGLYVGIGLCICFYVSGCGNRERSQEINNEIPETVGTYSSDSQDRWTDSLTGNWDARLVCTATTCTNYVIGDQRMEHWTFLSDTSILDLTTEAKTGGRMRYKGKYRPGNREITLVAESERPDNGQMVIYFSDISRTFVRAEQRSTGPDKCELIFSVQLTPKNR